MKVKVCWSAEDGSFGAAFTQTTEFCVDDDEWKDMCEDERYEYAYEEVYEDFQNKVRPGFEMSDIHEIGDD